VGLAEPERLERALQVGRFGESLQGTEGGDGRLNPISRVKVLSPVRDSYLKTCKRFVVGDLLVLNSSTLDRLD
jgi:hypothetical protein